MYILFSLLLIKLISGQDLYCEKQASFISSTIGDIPSHPVMTPEKQDLIKKVRSGEMEFAHVTEAFPVESDLPSSRSPKEKTFGSSERALLEVSYLMDGVLVGYTTEYQGCHFHHLIPQISKENTQSSSGSTEFFPHTDNAFLPDGISPTHLVLAGLRSHPDAFTYVYPVDEIMKLLDNDTMAVLTSPLFNLTSPESFRFDKTSYTHLLHSPLVPLLYPCVHVPGKWCMRSENVKPLDNATAAYDKLLQIYPRVRQAVRIEPGDIFLFDNHRVLHGRSLFTPMYNDADRWLEREYLSPRWLLEKLGFDLAGKTHLVWETEQFLPYLTPDKAGQYYSGPSIVDPAAAAAADGVVEEKLYEKTEN